MQSSWALVNVWQETIIDSIFDYVHFAQAGLGDDGETSNDCSLSCRIYEYRRASNAIELGALPPPPPSCFFENQYSYAFNGSLVSREGEENKKNWKYKKKEKEIDARLQLRSVSLLWFTRPSSSGFDAIEFIVRHPWWVLPFLVSS